jgi:tetratricopeptide (TPR) repeat protein
LYTEIQRYDYHQFKLALPDSETLACRYHAYRAGQFHQEQDWAREREELERAIKFDKTDADVLIAMYRVPEADDSWRASVRKQIAQLCGQFQQEIDEAPGVAMYYNQWAWLVSNTEGDLDKAIRYSHRSLELNAASRLSKSNSEFISAEASYLDTLARCYYAAGDYENAVKYERQAIERVDYMQVMHRQLALVEKALAEKKAARSEDRGASEEPKSGGTR